MDDLIQRQAAIEAIYACYIGGKEAVDKAPANDQYAEGIDEAVRAVEDLPPVQPEPAIPLQWIEAQIEWLKSLGNGFSTLAAGQISAMVDKWKEEQDG